MTKKVIIDTNIILRYVLNDNPNQNAIAKRYLDNADIQCVVSAHVLCEVDWVLRKTIKINRGEVASFFEKLQAKSNIVIDKSVFEIGLYFLKNGGDFADGVIAYQTKIFDDASLLTFDKDARKLAETMNIPVESF